MSDELTGRGPELVVRFDFYHPVSPLLIALVGVGWSFLVLIGAAAIADSVSLPIARTIWFLVSAIPGVVAYRSRRRALERAGRDRYLRLAVRLGVGLAWVTLVTLAAVYVAGIAGDLIRPRLIIEGGTQVVWMVGAYGFVLSVWGIVTIGQWFMARRAAR